MLSIQKKNKKVSQDDVGTLFLLLAAILGGWVRLYPAMKADFPINDGGMFFSMTKALENNTFQLPKFFEYNGLQIPFAYPPLGFYLTGSINQLIEIPLLEIFRWLPGIVLFLTIFAFFNLAKCVLGSRFQAGLATLIYALLPRSITWLVMGGGVTRSLGQLFLMMTIQYVYMLLSKQSYKYIFPAILSSVLVCLSHPEATIHTVGIAIIICSLKVRSKKSVILSIIIALGTLILTSPWWVSVLINHGISPYINAAQTGLHEVNNLLYFWLYPFSEESLYTTIILLALFGIAVKIVQKDYFLPLFYFIPFVLEPRSAATVATIPMAMMASVALDQLILRGLARLEAAVKNTSYSVPLQSRIEKIALIYLVLSMAAGMFFSSMNVGVNSLTLANRNAFEWISQNIPPGSRFIIMTGNPEPFSDPIQEWFPTLTGRISQTTLQGYEWIDGNDFSHRKKNLESIQSCMLSSTPAKCLQTQFRGDYLEYDYIYVTKLMILDLSSQPIYGITLINELTLENSEYTVVYQSNAVTIFKRNPK